MRQSFSSSKSDDPTGPTWSAALRAVAGELGPLAIAVARDISPGGEPGSDDVAAARVALDRLVEALSVGPTPPDRILDALRRDGAAAARAGAPLQRVLDATLSAGWVLWGAATAHAELPAPVLAALGDALLRTGDAAAAAIAEGHATAERELARRSAALLRELLDELLAFTGEDPAARARLVRRLADLGIPAAGPLRVVVAEGDGDGGGDEEAAAAELARRLGRGSGAAVADLRALAAPGGLPVVGTTAGRVVAIVPGTRSLVAVEEALDALGPGWVGVVAPAVELLAVGAALGEAVAALPAARSRGARRSATTPPDTGAVGSAAPATAPARLVEAGAVALERALLADPSLLRSAVERELGALADAPRGGDLVETLEAFFSERENLRATARRLGVAARTVSYRLERIERILGGPLDEERRLRLAAALFARGLVRD